ncbi:MAG: methyltransferase type 11, partial [Planctomycetota bacterium]|nr:methyltransferase type 11 [Planctomycetota bacterium]
LPQPIREHAAAYAACVAGAVSEDEYLGGLRTAGLEDVRITERQVYAVDQIRGIVAGDLDWAGLDPATLDSELDALEGKVASVRVTGRRP